MLRHNACLALIAALLLAGCGGSEPASLAPPADPPDVPAGGGGPLDPSAQVLRSVSGAPIGIRLGWFKQFEDIVGYHLYFDDQPIPDSARGDESMMVQVGGDVLIPQPGGSQPVSVDHIFPVQVGETWYYRLTSVWLDDAVEEESIFAGELQVDITPFTVASIENPNVGVGTTLFIDGLNFGQQDAGDTVEFPGVEWVPGAGFQPVMIPGTIMSWTQTRIGARVPLGATSGNIDVTIGGLTGSTPDVFTNSQPYITSLTPLAADMTEDVTIVGNNFGALQDNQHFVKFAGIEMTPPDNYVSYSNTQIVFKPLNLQDYTSKEVRIGSGGFLSNIGFLDLENAPPVPFLRANPASGTAPLAVKFEPIEDGPGGPQSAYDPEGTALTYGYDFEDDGTIDLTFNDQSQAPFTYDPSITLVHTCRLTLTDADGGTAEDTVDVTTTNPAMQLTDNGSPAGKNLYQSDGQIPMKFSLSGGVPNYRVTWVLIDNATDAETVLTVQNGVAPGNNSHNFDIDTSSSTPVAFSNTVPFGHWRIRADADDIDNGSPGVSLEFPTSSPPYHVYRYQIGLIEDAVGDPGQTIGTMVDDDLTALGYEVLTLDSATMVAGDLTGLHAVIWPGQQVVGQALPYEWIGSAELALMTTYLDASGNMIVLAPPSAGGNGAFPQDATFNSTHQPYISVVSGSLSSGLDCLLYTESGEYTVDSLTVNGPVGRNAPGTALTNGGVAHVQNAAATGFFNTFTANATGVGGVYISMLAYDSITFPVGVTRQMYVDNIVAGTIGF